MTTCPCGGSCACHSNGAYPPPCTAPGGCGLTDQPAVPTCAATGCDWEQAAGSLLCGTDSRRLGDWLAQIGDEYNRLTAMPSMQGSAAGRTSGGHLASHRNPGQLDVMVLRDRRSRERSVYDPDGNNGRGVLEVLAARAAQVREDRGLVVHRIRHTVPLGRRPSGPVCADWCDHGTCIDWTMRGLVPEPPTVASERRLLAVHLDWILGQDWAGEFFDEMRALFGLLLSSNGNTAPKRVHRLQAPCTACGVRAVTHRPGDDLMQCQSCGATQVYDDQERISA